jgi:Cof subfamily protein (haloacid dehalogenase superfamily)
LYTLPLGRCDTAMELIVFDLDGTLLDRSATISPYTRDTLRRLTQRGIAYTVATGRNLHGARSILDGHGFHLPQVYKNGVMIWNPRNEDFSHTKFLTLAEIEHVLEVILQQRVTPFIFTLESDRRHAVYHPPLRTEVEMQLAADFSSRDGIDVLPVEQLPADAQITNISAVGLPQAIDPVENMVMSEPNLIAYAGTALEGAGLKWIDVHHGDASKGGAVDILRTQLGATRVLCFGDARNDLSMFARADESYAPENALPQVKAAASAVIGNHDDNGIARFLRERFELGAD